MKYNVGDISSKTGLQKQQDGTWSSKEGEVDKTSYQDFGSRDTFLQDLYSSSYVNSLSEIESLALDSYRDNDYVAINSRLRSGEELNSKRKQQVQHISNVIKKSVLKHDIVLKRGISTGNKKIEDFFNSLKVGDVYSDTGFCSTTISDKAKDKFKEKDGISISILAKKGKPALSMQNIGSESTKTMYKDEYEFLLDRDTKFKVLKKEGREITVELL